MRKTEIEIRLREDTPYEYDTGCGQTIIQVLPKGTIMKIPIGWIYSGVPVSLIVPAGRLIDQGRL